MKTTNKNWHALVYSILLGLAVVAVYATGLHNALIFDDVRLTEGTLLADHSNLLQFRQRLISYGSFAWVHSLVGENWPVQRGVNLMLHLATCWALYRLFALLLPRIAYDGPTRADPEFAPSQLAALKVGIVFFALNPVAVYAVGYLIQRSIVMATLFSVLACWAFVRALTERKAAWYGAALLFYVLAAFSKEHAFLLVVLGLPLYVFLIRPSWQRAMPMFATLALLLAAGLAVVLKLYPDLLGHLFDETSRQLANQLDKQRPGALGQIFALSVLNEAALFFYYGLLWLVPYVGWMSIDMHPPFPLTLTSMPHLLGLAAYVALLGASVVAVLRRSDVWGFVGLCLLFPLVLFWTEFSTVWVQDPFVLYRGYLWAIPIPALIALLLTGFSPATLYKFGAALAIVLGALSIERVATLANDLTVWTDVIQKTEVPGSANAVGRNRAFLYRGLYHLQHLAFEPALQDFQTAHALGDFTGEASFEKGVTLQALSRHAEALQAFLQSEAMGYKTGVLYFHRAESQYAEGRLEAAMASYGTALANRLDGDMKTRAQSQHAEIALQLRLFSVALHDFEQLLASQPQQARYLMGKGLSRLGTNDGKGALDVFNELVQVQPDALAFYGRALAQSALGNKSAALEDIAKSVQMEPGNAVYKQVQQSIKSGEKLSL